MRPISAVGAALMTILVVACASPGATPGPSVTPVGGKPIVSIAEPANGATVASGAEVAVLATASDVVGVTRLDLAADGVVVDSYTTPQSAGQPSVSAELRWTPRDTGAHSVSVTAYRADGTASQPAVIAVLVSDPAVSASPSVLPDDVSPSPGAPSATPEPLITPSPRPTRAPVTPTPSPRPLVIDLQRDDYRLSLGTDPDFGDYVDLAIIVKNVGTDPARKFMVATTCLGFTQTQLVPGIRAKGGYELQYRFYKSVEGSPFLPFVVEIDSTFKIRETDENNNVWKLWQADARCDPTP